MSNSKKSKIRRPDRRMRVFRSRLSWKNLLSFRSLNFLLYGAVLLLVFWLPYVVGEVAVREGEVAPRDIIAPQTVEIVDERRTEELRQRVGATVSPVYVVDPQVEFEVREELEVFISELNGVREGAGSPTSLNALQRLREEWNVNENVLLRLVAAEDEEYRTIKNTLRRQIDIFLERPVREEDMQEVTTEISGRLEDTGLEPQEANTVHTLFQNFFRPNAVIDPILTEAERERVLDEVRPVRRLIQRGQTIVRRGDIVTEENMEILRSLGLSGERQDYAYLGVLAVIVFFAIVFDWLFLRKFASHVLEKHSLLAIRILTVAGVLLLTSFTLRLSWYFVLLPAIPLVLFAFSGRTVALGECLILLPLLLWGERVDFMRGIFLYLNLLLPLFFLGHVVKRQEMIQTGFLLATCNVFLALVFGFLEAGPPFVVFSNAMYGLGGGIGASILALGGIAFFESTFRLSTDFRLLEIVNPTHSLLKRLMMEAPGTYNHSLLVASMAEAAAEEIGANPLLVRAGAYYHDIGKIRRPFFFIENQLGAKNIHNRLSPNLSALIIQNHVKEGVEMSREYGLPLEIQEIIRSHHGTNIIRFFYDKALRERRDPVREEEFRYSGPHPQTPEEVLVFLADSVEAAVRCMSRPTPSRIETIVNNILQTYLKDGQLDESRLTLRDLHTITRTFVILLSGMLHARVSYPEVEK